KQFELVVVKTRVLQLEFEFEVVALGWNVDLLRSVTRSRKRDDDDRLSSSLRWTRHWFSDRDPAQQHDPNQDHAGDAKCYQRATARQRGSKHERFRRGSVFFNVTDRGGGRILVRVEITFQQLSEAQVVLTFGGDQEVGVKLL